MQQLRTDVSHQTTKGDLLTMGEGAQAGGAVDQVHAHAHQAEHQTEDDTGKQLLPNTLADIGAGCGTIIARRCGAG